MNTTDTPLTDAAAGYPDVSGYWRHNDLGLYVDADFARDIERRLAVATALLTRARNNVIVMPHELYDDIQHFLNAP